MTLDSGFEVRVWDVTQALTIDRFRPPAGSFFPSNAAVAISDDAQLVAYASGGEPVSHALIRDVRRRTTLAEWELPPAFQRMAYADGRFLLVREEPYDSGSGGTVQTDGAPRIGGGEGAGDRPRCPCPGSRRRIGVPLKLTDAGRKPLRLGRPSITAAEPSGRGSRGLNRPVDQEGSHGGGPGRQRTLCVTSR